MPTLWRKYSFVILFIAITFVFGVYLVVSLSEDAESTYIQVEIKDGDSLWSLSRQYADDLSMTEIQFIEWVTENNNLSSYKILSGEQLMLPISITDSNEFRYINDGIELASDN
ncbi:cell division suppressor protein YneA [Jeotgalibacillus soli]|uniref:LysM domain-containing protein n=1 Tax=Jeotgalibacillus soli TaxID=889306 RepID=A0A0C2R462_9BACL|nr:LysM peptidoglycan-binding domain-containing protein [Jeotgalibacillus soli]KIL45020.1 hypothetical protein KP78_25640 [Jeotgalibacillus soli]